MLLIGAQVFGQMKTRPAKPGDAPKINLENLSPVAPIAAAVPAAPQVSFGAKSFRSLSGLPKPVSGQPGLQAFISTETGTSYLIKGELPADPARALEQQVAAYLEVNKTVLKLDDPVQELAIQGKETDALGYQHIRLQQQWMGVPVYSAEAILHEKDSKFYLFNGRFYQSPKLSDVMPAIAKNAAELTAMNHVGTLEKLKTLTPNELHYVSSTQQAVAELVIFYPNANEPHLTWHVTVVPNIAARYSYFVDAKTGEILSYHTELCKIAGHFHGQSSVHSRQSSVRSPQSAVSSAARTPNSLRGSNPPSSVNTKIEGTACGLKTVDYRLWTEDCGLWTENCGLKTEDFKTPPLDGPATANATDLLGQNRTINTYQVGNTYYLINSAETMYNIQQSNFPDEPVGVIWTIDAQNTSPENNNFGAVHITSGNNSWNNPKAVSAHYHAQKAFLYFKNTFSRNSINGQGGNIVSLINVVDGDNTQMDNAFWNGQAMFYGNGNQAFTAPLAKALDVSGHEMSHGVIQETANLEYLNESGALNESFADVFGAMIDRDDWKMGEDVTNSQFFPTGALRDLSNPHNGGNSLNDNGWQPDHYSERYNGSDDNGGVHINSGIPNKAFFLFASNSSVGKDKAEKVYYRALSQYLVKSSNFVDCRLAVVQAATDLFGANSNEVNAAKSAFDAVGIGSSGGTGGGQNDIPSNPGDDYILMTDSNSDQLYIFSPDGTAIFNPITPAISPLSRPSVTDDGSVIVYIDQTNRMRAITVNWASGITDNQIIQNDPIWYNVAVSKDGSKIAAITTDKDDFIQVYDFGLQAWESFELYNPTTASGQVSYNVEYPDVLEWDVTGQWVMYDALSQIENNGNPIEYWDIGFVYVWDGNNFGNGFIEKLFSSLPENVSVGNPTFSKNSDYIIAFDYLDEYNEEYYLLASNVQTGEVGTIYQGSDLHWPNYSTDDTRIVFNGNLTDGTEVLAFIPLASDKINPSGDATSFLEDARQGVWFADGVRPLAAHDLIAENDIRLYPNPVGEQLNLDFTTKKSGDVQVQIFDLLGRLVWSEKFNASAGKNHYQIGTERMASGQYFVRMSMAEGQVALKFLKE